MTSRKRSMSRFLVAVIALAWAAGAPEGWAKEDKEIPFSIAKMIIEYNATANDIGVQVLLDGEPWNKVVAFDPKGRRILDIHGKKALQLQGLTELFFESSEPSLDELPLKEFLARFPAGKYEFEGVTIDGLEIEGKAKFTHVIPAGPQIMSPVSNNNKPPKVVPENFVIEWFPVTDTFPSGGKVRIVGYQVIVEQVEPLRVFSIDLPAKVTSVQIPPEFFVQLGVEHKFEVLAIEKGGNQTITEGTFIPMP